MKRRKKKKKAERDERKGMVCGCNSSIRSITRHPIIIGNVLSVVKVCVLQPNALDSFMFHNNTSSSSFHVSHCQAIMSLSPLRRHHTSPSPLLLCARPTT